jgi:ADP-ribose pyrophosphatase YjhB (NUDIX family)
MIPYRAAMITYCPRCATRVEERLVEGKLRPVCPSCGYIAFADPKVSATVLVERDGAILFIRRTMDPGRGLWCFPGGFVDFGEDPMLAAARECREETGIVVKDLRLLNVAFNGRVIVITYTTSSLSAAEPLAGDDADMAAWFVPPNIPPLAFPNMEQTLMLWQRGRARQDVAARHTQEGREDGS